MDEPIINLLREITATKGKLNILSIYKGLPLSSPAVILECGQVAMLVQIDKNQAVSMFTDKFTFLQSSQLPEIVSADVAYLDFQQQRAQLFNFRYAKRGIGKRRMIRVTPADTLSSDITDRADSSGVRGELADISQDGIGIYLSKDVFKSRQFPNGVEMIINLTLPGVYTLSTQEKEIDHPNESLDRFSSRNVRFNPIGNAGPPANKTMDAPRVNSPRLQIHAVVVNVIFEPAHARYRLGFKINPTDASRAMIAQFVAQRQAEIIREVRSMYDLLTHQ
jgi:hypothetical protein